MADHDVGRLDISMQDPLLMGVMERHGGLPERAEHLVGRDWLGGGKYFIQGRRIRVFHRIVGQVPPADRRRKS